MILPYTKLFYKRKRGLKLIFLPHFLHDFWRKIFSTLSFINLPNSIASLSLLLEILDNTCLGNNCCLFCDVRNFEINYSFLIKSFFYIKHNLAKKNPIKSIHHDKNPILTMKNKQTKKKNWRKSSWKYITVFFILFWTHPHRPLYNMLQPLFRWKKYEKGMLDVQPHNQKVRTKM